MKKILILIVSAVMVLSLCACGKSDDSSESSNKIIVKDPESGNIGSDLKDEFNKILNENPDMTAQAVADAIVSNKSITFQAMTMPVENGLLTGFGNTEITGFKEGVMFGPSISSIPFIGYIFIIEDDTDLIGFMNVLNNCADKRWNVCTEADNVIVDNIGNTVFFLMCPDKIEE